jgi:DNA-binding winged helix-turn-helix (wHTH) protein
MENTENKVVSFGGFKVDENRRLLLKQGKAVSLNPKTFDLLLVLLKHRGKIVSKNELLETVWENQFVEENNLTVHIAGLRKIFGEKKGENQFIVTVPGKGYKFIADIGDESNNEIIIENHRFEKIVVDEEIESNRAGETRLLSPKRKTPALVMFSAGLLILTIIGSWKTKTLLS